MLAAQATTKAVALPAQNADNAVQAKGGPAKLLKLEEALEKAAKQNPDIILAKAKVREAEAEYNRLRQQIPAKTAELYADLLATSGIVKEVEAKLTRLKRVQEPTRGAGGAAIVTEEDIAAASFSVEKYRADVQLKKAELPLLTGATVKDANTAQPKLEEALDYALKHNGDIIVAEAKLHVAQTESDRTRQQTLAKIAAGYSDVEISRVLVDHAKSNLLRLKTLRSRSGTVITDQDIMEAETILARYTAEMALKEALLHMLLGDVIKPGFQK